MPKLDAAATAQMQTAFARGWFIFLDIAGAPQRGTNVEPDVTFQGTGDPDLDGFTFASLPTRFVEISEIATGEGGSETVTLTLSGILSIESDLLNLIGDRSKWAGRSARIWMQIYDETGATKAGAIVPLYSGFMTQPEIVPSPTEQVIRLKLENWLASSSEASNRDYLSQADFDPADQSARATISSANAGSAGPAAGIGPGSGGGGGGGGFGHKFLGRVLEK